MTYTVYTNRHWLLASTSSSASLFLNSSACMHCSLCWLPFHPKLYCTRLPIFFRSILSTYAGLPNTILESPLRATSSERTIILRNELPNCMQTSYALISSTQEKCWNISGERNIASENIWHLEEHLSCKWVLFFAVPRCFSELHGWCRATKEGERADGIERVCLSSP